MKNTSILICGIGNVGGNIRNELLYVKEKYKVPIDVYLYDKYKKGTQEDGYVLNISEKAFDFAFVCVPTQMKKDGACDISQVKDVVSKVKADVVIIKSTIPIGTSEKLRKKYKKNIVFSPEYYGTTIQSPKKINFAVLAGDKRKTLDKVACLYHKIYGADFTIRFTNYKTAELAKYMENFFLASKVTFCAEFYKIAKHFNISYNDLREIFVLDERMGKSHTYINPDAPYYDSHCLNKDIPALLKTCKEEKIDVRFLESVFKTNERMKNINWEVFQ